MCWSRRNAHTRLFRQPSNLLNIWPLSETLWRKNTEADGRRQVSDNVTDQ